MKKIIFLSAFVALICSFAFTNSNHKADGSCNFNFEINSWHPFNGQYWTAGGLNMVIDTVWYFNDIPAGDSVRIHYKGL